MDTVDLFVRQSSVSHVRLFRELRLHVRHASERLLKGLPALDS
jgi:hypothetical protein